MSTRIQCRNVARRDVAYELRGWLVAHVSEALEMNPAKLDIYENLEELGLDSLQAISIAGYLEEWLGFKIPESVLEDFPTIESASAFILSICPDPDYLAFPPRRRATGGVFFTAP